MLSLQTKILGLSIAVVLLANPAAARYGRRAGAGAHPVPKPAAEQAAEQTTEQAPAQSAEQTRATIEGVVANAEHPYLRWHRFPDYQQDLRTLYEAGDYELLWTDADGPSAAAREAIDTLAAAGENGLRPQDYEASLLDHKFLYLQKRGREPGRSSVELALFDTALTVSLMRFVSDLYQGRTRPAHVYPAGTGRPKRLDVAGFVRMVAGSAHVARHIAALEPNLAGYRQLKLALARYKELTRVSGLVPLPIATQIRPGDRYRGMPELRRLLVAVGDLAADEGATEGERYAGAAVEAVKRFQARHGLKADGIIGRNTFARLNTPFEWRVRQIELAMERYRWPPSPAGNAYIVVNVPAFRLSAYGPGAEAAPPELEMNIIVGKAVGRHQTPVFMAEMRYLIFRPYWNVPRRITVAELLPQIRRDSGYIEREHLELVARYDDDTAIQVPSQADIAKLSHGALLLRQRPGPHNALGLVKFMFPNPHNVYLHSTPASGLFEHARRDFSHGCIRVEEPVGLAQFALRDDPTWTYRRIRDAMYARHETTRVDLQRPIAVFVLYATVAAGHDGTVRFFDDIYGRDVALDQRLAQGHPYLR